MLQCTHRASKSTGVPVRIYAVEKNLHAVITLRNRAVAEEWENVRIIEKGTCTAKPVRTFLLPGVELEWDLGGGFEVEVEVWGGSAGSAEFSLQRNISRQDAEVEVGLIISILNDVVLPYVYEIAISFLYFFLPFFLSYFPPFSFYFIFSSYISHLHYIV